MAEEGEALAPAEPVQIDGPKDLVALTNLVTELTLFVGELNRGLAATLAEIPDEETKASIWAQAHKDALSSFYAGAQTYTTAIIAGGYVAYFTTLSLLSDRFSDRELGAAVLSITVSLSIFVLHEVYGAIVHGIGSIKGNLEDDSGSRRTHIIWGAAMLGTLLTALPAMGIIMYVCFKHLLGG
jgi:hypothetical protein